MAAPVPSVATYNGPRTWYAELLADLEAMTRTTRGPRGELLRENDVGFVFGSWTGIPVIYTAEAPGDVATVWNAV